MRAARGFAGDARAVSRTGHNSSMPLKDSYRVVKRSVVAFCPKYIQAGKAGRPPIFPPIIGTGFIVSSDGIICTGYPMGTDALTAPGYVHQITPTLQRGIVSAVLPFECDKPHAFTINVMTQGGASGSPVFEPESGEVVGVLYAGLNDVGMTQEQDSYRIPTNISYVVPAHLLRIGFTDFSKNVQPHVAADLETIDEMVAKAQLVNILEKGRQWEVREIKVNQQGTDAVRLTEIKRTSD